MDGHNSWMNGQEEGGGGAEDRGMGAGNEKGLAKQVSWQM